MKTKADYIEKLNREINEKIRELHEVFGVDLDTLDEQLKLILLYMRAAKIEE